MDLTPDLKFEIDHRSYRALLAQWRFAGIGSAIFQGESGAYYAKVMREKKEADPEGAIAASKELGWEK
jgi:hypothetical protein